MPFAREFTTTPVNSRSHARQGVPRIWAVARQAGSDVGLITVDLITVELNNLTPNGQMGVDLSIVDLVHVEPILVGLNIVDINVVDNILCRTYSVCRLDLIL